MDVRILGPLELSVDGAPVAVTGAAERELFARLAVAPGVTLSADRLIEDLWTDRTPVDAVNALQTRVSKLRRALAAAGGDAGVVETRRPGYVLRLAPDAIDAGRFAQRADEARRLRDQGTLAAAADAYAEALALWRGAALVEFDAPWATTESARLEQARLAATEARTDVLLAMGRHAECIGDLEALVRDHPLRERLLAQLMLALYRSGRQADALARYAGYRRTLADELGIDPGEELQRLEEAVLRQDPALASPVRGPEAARVVLPRRRTSFVGRDAEIGAVCELVGDRPLVTLTGPGGAGKTTLAIEAARRLGDRFPDGGAFVSLSGVGDPALVVQAAASALGVPSQGSGTAGDRLVRALASRRALVVLDNCEHVAAAAAELAEDLLDACEQLRIVATSREPLGIDGETQVAVPPLPLPEVGGDVADLARNPAVRLFVDRAQAVDPAFRLDADNAGDVAAICTALDGMPLAIELAAARVKLLRPADIAARLDDRFALLTQGRRTAEARHQTLRATVDWSHDLLTRSERLAFRRLSVFRGGWTLDGAEEVCADNLLDAREVMELTGRLVDRSLVVADTATGRFRMLSTLRHYAQQRLAEAGEERAVVGRFVRHMLDLAERAEVQLRSGQQAAWLARLRAERDNLYQALGWCVADPAALGEAGLRIVGALGWWWYLGRHDEGRDWVDRLLRAVPTAPPDAVARAHRAASMVWRPGGCVVHPDPRCAAEARAAMQAAAQVDAPAEKAYAQALLAVEAVGGMDPDEAAALLGDAQRYFRPARDAWGAALAAFVWSEIAFHRATLPFDDAVALSNEAAQAFGALGDEWGLSAVLAHQAHALERAGEYERALAVSQRVVAIARRLQLVTTLQWMLAEVARLHLVLGTVDAAEPLLREALDMAEAVGGGPGQPASHLGFALLARIRGERSQAATHFDDAAEAARDLGMTYQLVAALAGRGQVARTAGDIGTAQARFAEALAVATEAGTVGETPAALEGLAAVAAARGDGRCAARLLGAAAAARERYGRPADPLHRPDVDAAVAATRALLDPAEYDAALAEGRRTEPLDVRLPSLI